MLMLNFATLLSKPFTTAERLIQTDTTAECLHTTAECLQTPEQCVPITCTGTVKHRHGVFETASVLLIEVSSLRGQWRVYVSHLLIWWYW